MTVILSNGVKKVIHADILGDMIIKDQIIAFERSDGWAVIGRDPIRESYLPEINTGDGWSDL